MARDLGQEESVESELQKIEQTFNLHSLCSKKKKRKKNLGQENRIKLKEFKMQQIQEQYLQYLININMQITKEWRLELGCENL